MTDRDTPKRAVALKYDASQDAAPRIVAKGQGELAERIVAIAKNHQVVVKQDADLVNYLYQVDIYDQIPTELYGLVAELLVFVYSLDQKAGSQR